MSFRAEPGRRALDRWAAVVAGSGVVIGPHSGDAGPDGLAWSTRIDAPRR